MKGKIEKENGMKVDGTRINGVGTIKGKQMESVSTPVKRKRKMESGGEWMYG